MNPTGIARSQVDILDLSQVIATGLKGIVAVTGPTERGVIGKPVLVGSYAAYRRNFGGLLDTSDFPLLCRRALEGGAKLMISRAGHYTDQEDLDTKSGTVATINIAQAAVAEVDATGTIQITAATDTASSTLLITAGNTVIVDESGIADGISANDFAVDIQDWINAGTGTHGFTAVAATDTVTVTAPTGQGALINGTEFTFTTTSGATATLTAFSGGVTAVQAGDVDVNADDVGTGYNGIVVTISAASSGNADDVDIAVTVPGASDLDQLTTVKRAPNTGELAAINSQLNLIDIVLNSGVIPYGTGTLASGAQDITEITTVDYIGSSITKTGIRAFDNEATINKISVPHVADPTLDAALVAYADERKDIIAFTRTPVGLNGEGVQDYRNGTGIYSHASIDSFRGRLFTGGLRVQHPANLNEIEIPEIADVFYLFSNKDNNYYEWFAAGGPKRGRIKNALGVVQNFGSPGNQAQADAIDALGVDMVIDHPNFGPVLWSNGSLWKSNTLLKHGNIAELVVFLHRGLKPLIDSELFDPNDIFTWKAIYRRIVPLMDFVQANRGVYGYVYNGDQDVDSIDDAEVNSDANISAGQYKFNLHIQPTPALKYINARLVVTSLGVDLEAVTEEAPVL